MLKQGDIGRSIWDSGVQSVRQSLNDIFDVYLRSHVAPEHQNLPRKVILGTSGDLKEEVNANWVGYAHDNVSKAEFEFWGADEIAIRLERHMLDEHLFTQEDRSDLRRALALIGEIDYEMQDFHRLLLRQLGLNRKGELLDGGKLPKKQLIKAFTQVNLSTKILARWAISDGNTKNALFAVERALLWSWHRVQLEDESERKKYFDVFGALWQSYQTIAVDYFQKLQGHYYVRDGMSGYTSENALFSIIVFEHIGILATIGLAQIFHPINDDDERKVAAYKNADIIVEALCHLIENNPVANSPRLDENSLDITLAFIFLLSVGKRFEVEAWLVELVKRLDYVFKVKRHFPVCTDLIDDVIELECVENEEREEVCKRLMQTSWLLPTLAGWAVNLQRSDVYDALAKNTKEVYPEICKQLWHPAGDSLFEFLYFQNAHFDSGETDAPIAFPPSMEEFKQRMLKLLESKRHDIHATSPSYKAGLPALDIIACRHFRTPVPPFLWFQFAREQRI